VWLGQAGGREHMLCIHTLGRKIPGSCKVVQKIENKIPQLNILKIGMLFKLWTFFAVI
jgi:hypothetical protein